MSMFDSLMARLLDLQQRVSRDDPVIRTDADRALQRELTEVQAGIMNTDPLNACRCFMVTFSGKDTGEVTTADLKDVEGAVSRIGGALSTEVSRFLAEEQVLVTDYGGGVSGWHIGAHCTPGQAWLLVRKSARRFEKALAAKLMRVDTYPWCVQPYYPPEE